ncbi:MAG: enoyl-CoA hydratase [Gammaproteobacteria bacterium]
MTYQTIELVEQGAVARISLNRPDKLNAMNAQMLAELNQALDHIESNEAILAVVVNGNGRAFCSGFDLQAGIEANRQGESDWRAAIEYDLEVIMRFWHLSKPTIAVVHGYVLAGGFELALACDMTVCETNALFGEPELRFGSSIVALLLPWYTNPKRSKKILLSGQDRMPADEALQIGIVNEVVAEGEGLQRGLALAREVALMDPDSVRMTKAAINQTYEIMGLGAALKMGVDTSVKIETLETSLRKQFNEILRNEGMQAALKWREARLQQND